MAIRDNKTKSVSASKRVDKTPARMRFHLMSGLMAVLIGVVATPIFAYAEDFPTRQNPRPVTTNKVPHIQIGVEAVPELTKKLLKRISELPDVELRDTVMSLPGAVAFWISDDAILKHPEAIIRGREFAHVHPDGSLHASLDPKIAQAAIEAGWAISHPWSEQREGWQGFVMIYTPLSEQELDVVAQLVTSSYNYVTGQDISAR